MMRISTVRLLTLAFLMVIVLATAWAQKSMVSTRIEKSFSIKPGTPTGVMIPVHATGELKIEVAWTGKAKLLLTLRGSKTEVLRKTDTQSSPLASLTYRITEANRAKSAVGLLIETASDTSQSTNPIAVRLTVSGPAIIVPVKKLAPGAAAAPVTTPPALQSLAARVQEKARTAQKSRLTLLSNQAKQVGQKFRSIAAQQASTLNGRLGTVIKTLPAQTAPLQATTNNQPVDVATPTITRIEPMEGMPNAWATIQGTGLSASCTVHCLVNNEQDVVSPEVRLGNDGRISFRVPEVAINQPSLLGKVYVTAPAPGQRTLTSNQSNFTYVQARPTLTSVANFESKAEGEPRSTVMLYGTNFTRNAEVHFVIPGKPDMVATPDLNQFLDTCLVVTVPDYEGITAAINGTVYVKIGGNASEQRPFLFKPEILTGAMVNIAQTQPNLVWIETRTERDYIVPSIHTQVEHFYDAQSAGDVFMLGYTTIISIISEAGDWFFDNHNPEDHAFTLKNNWVVEDIILTKEHESDNIRLTETHIGTSDMHAVVRWSTGNERFKYWLTYIIKGPKGCSAL